MKKKQIRFTAPSPPPPDRPEPDRSREVPAKERAMDVLEAIRTRRTVRKFNPEPVSEDQIELLLRAAMAAPSANNRQPWAFVVILGKDTFKAFAKFHPHAAMLPEAAAAILICGDRTREPHEGYLGVNCAAAAENLVLAAHAAGLGAVWLGIWPREDRVVNTRELLGLPPETLPIALIALGHPAEHPEPADRFDPSRIHREKW